MEEPEEKHRRRGAHWTFDADRFVSDLTRARAERQGSFPSFDHAHGDPVEDQITVSGHISSGRERGERGAGGKAGRWVGDRECLGDRAGYSVMTSLEHITGLRAGLVAPLTIRAVPGGGRSPRRVGRGQLHPAVRRGALVQARAALRREVVHQLQPGCGEAASD